MNILRTFIVIINSNILQSFVLPFFSSLISNLSCVTRNAAAHLELGKDSAVLRHPTQPAPRGWVRTNRDGWMDGGRRGQSRAEE
eukprot:2567875-Rhodomonas_salina.4